MNEGSESHTTTQKPILRRGTWQRNLAVLWIGELIAIAGFSVTLPFLPYYVQELGITEVNQVAFWSGLVAASQASRASPMASRA